MAPHTAHRCATALRCDSITHARRRHRRSLRSLYHAAPARISWHRCTGGGLLSRMNDEPTNYTETCAKDLVRQGETGPVSGVEADGTAKQAKSKQKSEKEALKAAVDKADTAAHKAVSLAARAKATKAVSSVQTTSRQAICQVNIRHPHSPRGSLEACCEPPVAHRDRR